MNKRILTVAVAALALSACSKNETVEVAGNQAIKFGNAFVNNSTRAVSASITEDNFAKFYVFGDYENSGTWVDVFNNVEVTGTNAGGDNEQWTPTQEAYWQANKSYNFGAYANGTAQAKPESGVSFNPGTYTLNFTGYEAGENDLVAAVATNQSWNGTDAEGPLVPLTFKHLLSKVRFTFTTKAVDTYTIKVSDLTFTATKTGASCKYNGTIIEKWSGTSAAYEYDDIADYALSASEIEDGAENFTEMFVIPQANEDLTVEFTVSVYDGSSSETALYEKNFTASLEYGENSKEWQPGYSYNYKAMINPDDVADENKAPVILFTVTSVEGWTEADATLPWVTE